ncbi:MAG: WYL domain-containing protein [Idiomarina sp.]|nr:WYL domain-containing protein [Idiomarina sp.]
MSSKVRDTLSRQWEILKLLPSRGPGLTKRQVCDILRSNGFDVSERTVERDLNDLLLQFPLVRNDKSIPYGWYWAKHAVIHIPGVSAAEALSLCMVEQAVQNLLPSSVMEVMQARFTQAQQKLNSLTQSSSLQGWQHKVANVQPTLEQLRPVIDPQILETLQNALLHDEQLQVTYRALNGQQTKSYVLNPFGIVQRGVVTYVVGCVEPYSDAHLFAVHRLLAAERTADPVRRPDGFSLQNYIEEGGLQFSAGALIQLEAIIRGPVVQILQESPLSQDQELKEEKNEWQVKATVLDSWQLRWWILSQGENVQILAPDCLRNNIATTLKAALAQYQDH